MEVPRIVAVAVGFPIHADLINDPGAKMSTHVPKLENADRQSLLVEAPTVMAAVAPAGEKSQASSAELPAATTKTIPLATALLTAMSKMSSFSPPRLILTTLPGGALAAT